MEPVPTPKFFTVASLNVQQSPYASLGIKPQNMDGLAQLIWQGGPPDILVLSETYHWPLWFEPTSVASQFGYEHHAYTSLGSRASVNRNIGLGLMSRYPLDAEFLILEDRYCIKAWIHLPDGVTVLIYALYLDSFKEKRRVNELSVLLEDAAKHPEVPIIVAGDCNSMRPEDIGPSHRLCQRLGRLPGARKIQALDMALEAMKAQVIPLLREAGFSDEVAGGQKTFITCAKQVAGRRFGLHIDQIFTRGLSPATSQEVRWDPETTDHGLLVARFAI